jgi:hypothetical protein
MASIQRSETLDAKRKKMLKEILGAMLEGLAVSTEALDLTVLDTVGQKSRNLLRTPWAIDAEGNAEKPHDPVPAGSRQGPCWAAGRTDHHPRRAQLPYRPPRSIAGA